MFLLSSVLLATGFVLANAQTQLEEATIYEVTASLPSASNFGGFSQSVTFLPVATGTDGVTTYIEELVDSFSGTLPDLSGPVTYDFVFAESSAGYRASAFIPGSTGTPSPSLPPPAFVDTCTFVDYAPQGKGVCVQVLVDDRFNSAAASESESFLTLTFTGSVVPAFTYHDAAVAAVSTGTGTTSSSASSLSGYGPGWPWPTSGYGSGYGPYAGGNKKKKSPAGAIAGGVVGGLVGVAIVLGVWVVWLRRRRRRQRAASALDGPGEEDIRQVRQVPGAGPSIVAAAVVPLAVAAGPEAAASASEESTSGIATSTRKLSPLHRTTPTPTITNSSGPSSSLTSSPVQASGNATPSPETDGALAEQVRVMAERMAVMEAQLRMRGAGAGSGADGDSESVVDRPPRYSTTV